MLHRTLQALALLIAIGMLGFLACRAQSKPEPSGNEINPAAGDADAAAAPDAAANPEVYFPASKSGGAFLQHQQAPR